MNQQENLFQNQNDEQNDQMISNHSLVESLRLRQRGNSNQSIKLFPHQITLFRIMVQQMSISYQNSLFLILSSNCTNESEVLNLLADDNNGFFSHLFSPYNPKDFSENSNINDNNQQQQQNFANGGLMSNSQQNFDNNNNNKQSASNKGLFANNVNICMICQSQRENHILNTNQNLAEARQLQQRIDQFLNSNESLVLTKNINQAIVVRTCEICQYDVEQNLILMINEATHDVCIECFKNYLKAQIREGKVADIRCPHCQEKITDEILKQHLDNETFQKFIIFKKNYIISHDPLAKWCPKIGCGQVIQLQSKNQETAVCQNCQTEICCRCNRLKHDGLNCSKVLDLEIRQLTDSRDVQYCEKCKALVQKISGCNHMTCSVCQYQWCWLCGSTYSKFHFSFLNPLGCPFMQNGRFNNQNINFLKIWLIRIFTLLLLLLLTPFGLVFGGPILAIIGFDNCCGRKMHANTKIQKVVKFLVYAIIFILGLILDPLIAIALVIGLIPGIVYIVHQTQIEQARIQNDADANLREREQFRNNDNSQLDQLIVIQQ